MRTNIRLMGLIHGIVVLSLIGFVLLRFGFYGSLFAGDHHRVGGRDREGGSDWRMAILMLVLGGSLVVIGYVGAFFGKLIKAAVSRQREYLADASAVQFTRLPEGLAGALKKIGGYEGGSRINDARADQASHMFFGQSFKTGLVGLLATHPPLVQRIQKLDPSFKGDFPSVEAGAGAATEGSAVASGLAGAGQASEPATASASAHKAGQPTQTGQRHTQARAESGIGHIGRPTQAHLQYASELIRNLPDALKDAAHQAYGARAVVYALLIDTDPTVRDHQWQHLEQQADRTVLQLTHKLLDQMDQLDPAARLPLLDMTVPALRELSPTQHEVFAQNIEALIKADEKVDLFEWMIQRALKRYVAPAGKATKQSKVQYYSLKPVRQECALLLSTLAYIGHSEKSSARQAFEQARQVLPIQDFALREPDECSRQALDQALARLDALSPREKRNLLTACGACIAADKELTVREVELLRLVADSLHCPMPPVLPGQPVK
jgi:hypothetical protein